MFEILLLYQGASKVIFANIRCAWSSLVGNKKRYNTGNREPTPTQALHEGLDRRPGTQLERSRL